MYKLHLILKYLRKRRIAWVSLIAVMLCTAMVIVVISVMGGWVRMFRETNHALIGDLVVYRSTGVGFGHYQEVMAALEKMPQIKAVTPEIHTEGLLDVGYAGNGIRRGVMVVGVDIKRIGQVNGFIKDLYLQPNVLSRRAEEYAQTAADLRHQAATRTATAVNDEQTRYEIASDLAQADSDAARAAALRKMADDFPSWNKPLPAEFYREQYPSARFDPASRPSMILGNGIVDLRDDPGQRQFMYELPAKLEILKVTSESEEPSDLRSINNYWIIDDAKTGVFQVDQNTVYVPFDVLQKDLQMNGYTYTDARSGQTAQSPPRCNQILISLRPGYAPNAVKPEVQAVVDRLIRRYNIQSPSEDPLRCETWEEQQADFLTAVSHEESLLVILFGIISIVAIFLIFCIFFMIVVEKTRDIGIIKSVGATSAGIASIFLGYGLTIGIVGAGMGLLLGYLIVHNINYLHHQLEVRLHISVWNAKTYLFDTIPNQLIPRDVIIIVSVAVLSSVLGAVVPAVRAARMNPVEALRWE